ncbi:MAG: type I methionyl aminopeptidase [Candidatus Paceibacterota bacterium]|jgi:methionyl aminopeptidase
MNNISLKTKEQIEIMARGGKILAKILNEVRLEAKVGTKLSDLELKARDLIKKNNAKPAFLGHNRYPAALCASPNDMIVHGIPGEYILQNGDILSLDLGIQYEGLFTDMAITIGIGEIDEEKARLIRVAKKALKRAIKKMRPGNTIGDIGNTIERYVSKRGLYVIKELCGHGIGKELHEDPEILNYGSRGTGPVLKEGMVLCVEPMVSAGTEHIKLGKDGFTYYTMDNSLVAHFEHTIAITKNGSRVLTEIE